jgi:MFS family permease
VTEAGVSELRVRRLCAVSFLVDLAHYLVFGAIPFQAMRLGADAIALGLVPALYAVTYVVASMASGHLSDRMSRLALVRAGIVLCAIATLAIAATDRLGVLLALVPVTGLALGLFWSPVQAAVSDAASTRGLSGALGAFNVAWSAGKGLGFLLAGVITQSARAEIAVAAGVVPLLLSLAILPRGPEPRASAVPLQTPPVPWKLVLLAWLGNALAYGVSGTLNVHAPALLVDRGEGALSFGVFLGVVFAVQTVAFAWTIRRVPSMGSLAGAHAATIAALAIFLAVPGPVGTLASALPLGFGLALAYQASLYASLHRDMRRGSAAGIHESVLAIGSSIVPLAGGALAASSGSLTAPFIVCLVLLAAAFVASAAARASGSQRAAGIAKDRNPVKSDFGETGSSC